MPVVPIDRTRRPFVTEEAMAILARTPATLDALLRGLPDGWIAAHEGGETWSPFDVIGHLIHGEGRLDTITLADARGGVTCEVAADAMFIFIGSAPRTDIVAGLVERDAEGFILTGRDLLIDGQWPKTWTANREPFLFETSVAGVFAAGDARHGSGKRVAAAVGEGSATVSMVHQYLGTV